MEYAIFGLAMHQVTGARHWKSSINLLDVVFDAVP